MDRFLDFRKSHVQIFITIGASCARNGISGFCSHRRLQHPGRNQK
jgi:hypothetical protein